MKVYKWAAQLPRIPYFHDVEVTRTRGRHPDFLLEVTPNRPAPHIEWRLVEPIILILVVVVVLLLLTRGGRYLGQLIVNGIIGVILLFLTNLVLAEDIPINLLTVLICAIGGVVGWLVILVLHLLGIAFYVPA
jgi:SigmaK-factor processing regulatory protein BofA